jgi:hypothetical protein
MLTIGAQEIARLPTDSEAATHGHMVEADQRFLKRSHSSRPPFDVGAHLKTGSRVRTHYSSAPSGKGLPDFLLGSIPAASRSLVALLAPG